MSQLDTIGYSTFDAWGPYSSLKIFSREKHSRLLVQSVTETVLRPILAQCYNILQS